MISSQSLSFGSLSLHLVFELGFWTPGRLIRCCWTHVPLDHKDAARRWIARPGHCRLCQRVFQRSSSARTWSPLSSVRSRSGDGCTYCFRRLLLMLLLLLLLLLMIVLSLFSPLLLFSLPFSPSFPLYLLVSLLAQTFFVSLSLSVYLSIYLSISFVHIFVPLHWHSMLWILELHFLCCIRYPVERTTV